MKNSILLPLLLLSLSSTVYPNQYIGGNLPVNYSFTINQQDGGAIVTPDESILIEFQNSSKQPISSKLDWWLLAGSDQNGWFWHNKNNNSFSLTQQPASQEMLFNSGNSYSWSDLKGLPVDTYSVYFGADINPNGRLDEDSLGYSQTTVSVVAAKDTKFSYQSDFSQGQDGWQGNFVDLPVDYDPEIYELLYEYAAMPEGVNSEYQNAPSLQGHNRSDDLFMYMTRPITGLKHHTQYKVSFDILIASNAFAGGFGIGGAPGESVYFKAGVSNQKPEPLTTEDNYYRLNIDQGSQSNNGENAIVLDHIGVDIIDSEYKLKLLNNHDKSFEFSTGANDKVWLLLGTDSGFEGLTRIYIPKVNIMIEETMTH